MKILIIGPAWVGDMVMAQTLFITLADQYPGCQIDVVAPQWTAPLLARMPQVRRAIPMPVGHGQLGLGARLALGRELRGEGYEQAIVLPNSFKSALVPLFARIPRRTGWRGEARTWLLNDCRVLDKQRYPLMIERFAALAFPPDAPLPNPLPWPALSVDEGDLRRLREKFGLTGERRVLALCPGAEFGRAKKWPEAHYAVVARDAARQGRDIWLLGSAKDRETTGAIIDELEPDLRERCRDFAGQTSLGEAIDLLALADAVVSNDSGLMHIAAALQRPLVVIYGSTSTAFTPPLATGVRTLSLGLDCSPCFKRDCPFGHYRCLRDLAPTMVTAALAEVEGAARQVL